MCVIIKHARNIKYINILYTHARIKYIKIINTSVNEY